MFFVSEKYLTSVHPEHNLKDLALHSTRYIGPLNFQLCMFLRLRMHVSFVHKHTGKKISVNVQQLSTNFKTVIEFCKLA